VHEHILAAVIAHDEAEAFLTVEEFDDAGAFADDLGRHAAACAAACTTAKAATAAAAETTAASTAAAEAIAAATATATAESVATAAATAEAITAAAAAKPVAAAAKAAVETAFTAETIALIAPAPATVPAASFIETHALFVFPARPNRHINTPAPSEKRKCANAKPIASPSRCSVNHSGLRINSSEMRQGRSTRRVRLKR
jgi:hypothetical protein